MTSSAETVSVSDLLERAGRQVLDEASAIDLTRSLGSRGVRAEPSLFTILAERGHEHWTPGEFDSPGISAGADRVENASVTLRATPWLALQGVLLVGFVVSCVALYRWAPYGLAAFTGALAAAALAGPAFGAIDKRLPTAAPRGRVLGACLAAATTSLALVAFVALRRLTGL